MRQKKANVVSTRFPLTPLGDTACIASVIDVFTPGETHALYSRVLPETPTLAEGIGLDSLKVVPTGFSVTKVFSVPPTTSPAKFAVAENAKAKPWAWHAAISVTSALNAPVGIALSLIHISEPTRPY